MSELATVSTHVLDVASGNPAAGIRVTLGTRTLTTDGEGRIADLSGGGINPGAYRLLVEVGAYWGSAPHLFKTIALELENSEAGGIALIVVGERALQAFDMHARVGRFDFGLETFDFSQKAVAYPLQDEAIRRGQRELIFSGLELERFNPGFELLGRQLLFKMGET